MSWRGWPTAAVALGALLALAACAPNSARTPIQPRLNPTLAAAEGEDSRYGTLLRLARSTRAAGDPAAAVSAYQQAIALEQGRPEAYLLLGDTLIELKAYDEAAKAFQLVLKRDSGNIAAHRGYARVLLALNRPDTAILHYKAALAADPNDVQAYNGLGVAYDMNGQYEAAQAAYREGLEVAPDSMLLRNNYGLSLALAGKHEESLEILRAVVDEPGATARNRQNLALAYGLAGNLAEAERISRIDLDEQAVENNVAYFAALAAVEDGRQRAAALGVQGPQMADRASDAEANRRVVAVALEGAGVELGVSPTGRWFVNLGEFGSSAQAAAAWRQLRSQYGDVLGGLSRLAGVQEGPQPLLAGPLASAEKAQSLCETLSARGQHCRALPL
ncbi:MAG TPA: tetratricopeptide repeat protein [Geminicoccaceae bacterium]|nr:tetratricopeptide repeat protein [Geminicoccaceae bacterium]